MLMRPFFLCKAVIFLKKFYGILIWTLLAYVLCLMPGPGFWQARLAADDYGQTSKASGLKLRGIPLAPDISGHKLDVGSQELRTLSASTTNQELRTSSPSTTNQERRTLSPSTKNQEQRTLSPSTTNQELRTLSPRTAEQAVLFDLVSTHLGVKERAAHFGLMMGVAFCAVRLGLASGLGWVRSLVGAMVLVACEAGSIEWLQSLLPDWMARGFSMSDIWMSLAGGACGAGVGVMVWKQSGVRGCE